MSEAAAVIIASKLVAIICQLGNNLRMYEIIWI